MIKKFQFNKTKYKVDTDMLQGDDLVIGQLVFFKRNVYGGSYRNPQYIGCEYYIVKIIRESYGS